jgi:hypothetical protein
LMLELGDMVTAPGLPGMPVDLLDLPSGATQTV